MKKQKSTKKKDVYLPIDVYESFIEEVKAYDKLKEKGMYLVKVVNRPPKKRTKKLSSKK